MQPIDQHLEKYLRCKACDLGNCRKDRRVFYRGAIPCDVLFIGEASGDAEICIGEPFVGRSGDLLNKIIQHSIPDNYRTCFTNTIVCPPQDTPISKLRAPSKSEQKACLPRLDEFIQLCEPYHIVAVGKPAEYSLIQLTWEHTAIVHPSSILREEGDRFRVAVKRCIDTLTQMIT